MRWRGGLGLGPMYAVERRVRVRTHVRANRYLVLLHAHINVSEKIKGGREEGRAGRRKGGRVAGGGGRRSDQSL